MNPHSLFSYPAWKKAGRIKLIYTLLIGALSVTALNIYQMQHSVPASVREQYPVLNTFSNILYYSFLPFLGVLPLFSLLVASVLAVFPFRHFRYSEKLLPLFLGVLLILEAISLVMLLISGTGKTT